MNLTAKERGLTNHCNIFVLILDGIIFKIHGNKNLDFPFIIQFYYKEKISELIDEFLTESGLSSSEKIKFYYNGKILNESLTISEAGLKFNSEIIVKINDHLNYTTVNFKNAQKKQSIIVEYLLTEKMDSIFERYIYRTNNFDNNIEFFFNSKKIYGYLTPTEVGLKKDSIIDVS